MRKTSDIIWQDAQHQVLFEILDIIREPDTGRHVLFRLKEYTETHFALEESYMELLNYPGREEHIRAHDSFRQEVEQLLDNEAVYDPQVMEAVGTFLTEWLTRHVFGIDKDLERFILESGAA